MTQSILERQVHFSNLSREICNDVNPGTTSSHNLEKGLWIIGNINRTVTIEPKSQMTRAKTLLDLVDAQIAAQEALKQDD